MQEIKQKLKRIKVSKSRYISESDPCFVVAEMSANHAKSLKIAIKTIREAKKAGADAIKTQTYTPDMMTIFSNRDYFKIRHPRWGGQTLYELYQKAYMPVEWNKELKKVADDEGIIFFSTVFSKEGLDILEEINVPIYKIASFELTDLPLIEYVAKTKKPIILSTGMATPSEIKEALYTAKN
ncbi:MAG: N-acetylneuraminate synthase family protein, partial [Candidatus Omnitrophica bacterium]|nr:N-acetylneuraminate synthase family protein [Candidatus Omnitrophota bacterium]